MPATFAAMNADRDSFLRLLDEAIRQRQPAQVVFDSGESVIIYPRWHCHVGDIADWDALIAGGTRLRLLASSWDQPPPQGALPLEHLRWRAALHDHWIAPAAAVPASHELLHLLAWPDLARVPAELLAPVARICALLWRKPTVAYLVPRVLQLTPQQGAMLLAVLRALGHVAGNGATAPLPAAPAREPLPRTDSAPEAAAEPILAKLWQRLLRLQAA